MLVLCDEDEIVRWRQPCTQRIQINLAFIDHSIECTRSEHDCFHAAKTVAVGPLHHARGRGRGGREVVGRWGDREVERKGERDRSTVCQRRQGRAEERTRLNSESMDVKEHTNRDN